MGICPTFPALFELTADITLVSLPINILKKIIGENGATISAALVQTRFCTATITGVVMGVRMGKVLLFIIENICDAGLFGGSGFGSLDRLGSRKNWYISCLRVLGILDIFIPPYSISRDSSFTSA